MKCPECNHKNPKGATACESCYLNFSLVHTSKLAIISLILGISSLFLFVVTGLPAIILGIISFLKIRKRQGLLKGKGLAKAAILVSFILLGLNRLIFMDAAHIENDYTMDYFGTPDSVSKQSNLILQRLADVYENVSGAPVVGLSEKHLQEITRIRNILEENSHEKMLAQFQANKNAIISIWQNAQKGIIVFEQLDEFPLICDLTKPSLEDSPKFLKNYRNIIFVYQIYIYLQLSEGNYDVAAQKLFLLDSINKKLSLDTKPLVTKLVTLAIFGIEIQIMNFMINDADTPKEILSLLKQNINSFSEKYASLKNSIIFEYLTFKDSLAKINWRPLLKYNSSLKLRRNISEKWLALDENRKPDRLLKVWPDYYPNISFMTNEKEELSGDYKLAWYYKFYNPRGSNIEYIMRCNWEKVFEIKIKTLILGDLLKIVLNSRLGQSVDLNARAYGDEYIIDIENKKIFSPGPDGIKDTEDDIILPINPEVLGLTEALNTIGMN